MFHDGGQRHGEGCRQIADSDITAPFEFRQQRTPRRIGDGGKDAIEAVGRIVNHMVKYRPIRCRVKAEQKKMEANLRLERAALTAATI